MKSAIVCGFHDEDNCGILLGRFTSHLIFCGFNYFVKHRGVKLGNNIEQFFDFSGGNLRVVGF